MSAEPRGYRSPRRDQQAAQTRELVVEAASRLFSERGWAATGVRDVARAAGVSVETVYANFRTKVDLLLAAIDTGVVGDAGSVPLAERPEFAALGVGTSEERVTATARLLTGINQRTAGLRRALVEAAGGEPAVAATLEELERARRLNTRIGAELVAGGPVADDVVDVLWVLTGADVFASLTTVGGRSVEDYTAWLAAAIAQQLGGAS